MKLRISDWLQDIQHKQQGRAELKALMHFEIGPREVWHASEYKTMDKFCYLQRAWIAV